MSIDLVTDSATLRVENIGGISEQTLELSRGVTVLAGANATNRTSLLKALAGAQGSENVSLKGTASEGSVELSFDSKQYHRTIKQVNDSLTFEGESPVDADDREIAERFAFLFEDNQARQAIRRDENLRDVVMDPVDTDKIEAKIATLQDERDQKERTLEELESLQSRLPSLRQRRDDLAQQKESLEDRIASKKAEIELAEETVDESQEQKEAVDVKVEGLRTYQSELKATQSKVDTTKQTIEELDSALANTEAELTDLEPVDEDKLDDITAELDTLHERVAEKERMMSELQNIIQFNKEYIQGEGKQYPDALQGIDDEESTTTQLVDKNDTLVCWTCGSTTSQSNIADTVDRLQALHQDLHGERTELREQIDVLQNKKEELKRRQERRADLQASITDTEAKLEQQRERLSDLRSQRERLKENVATTEEELATLREEQQEEILDHHRELNELEIELNQTVEEYDSVRTEIETIETKLEQINSLQSEIEEISEDIEFLRGRVETIEREVIDSFNEHMDAILAELAYNNIERIWLDRRTTAGGSDNTEFALHVIRTDGEEAPYEDTISHLSESEREVTGLIFALAGYLVHDVHEKVPFMLLDSLEAIDSGRISSLLEYLRQYTENIVVALLEEDAQALSVDYTTFENPNGG